MHGDLGEGACIGKNIENVDEVAFVGNKGIENTSNVEKIQHLFVEEIPEIQNVLQKLVEEVCNSNGTVVNENDASRTEEIHEKVNDRIKESKEIVMDIENKDKVNDFKNFKSIKKGKETESTENECGLSCNYEEEQTGYKNFKCRRVTLGTRVGGKLVVKEIDNKKNERKGKDNCHSPTTTTTPTTKQP